ncbi:hypothetical protein QR680_007236 [Steinernema hermaphroditum]|uniref:Peptidase S1 domain-containing protein n=1 Tax=Steinernema hermaphroditum TaxID=289476 RepID=A0AA39HY29_9BILA|nr:hypothetical protein QR680_007236 [Steinernema hermaphroditum]
MGSVHILAVIFLAFNCATVIQARRVSCGYLPNGKRDDPLSFDGYLDKCQYPFFAHLESIIDGHIHECDGVLLGNHYVLMTASCLERQPDFGHYSVFFGLWDKEQKNDPNVQVRKIVGVIRHPQYSNVSFEHDLAVLELDHEVVYTSAVQPSLIFKDDRFMWRSYETVAVGYHSLDYAPSYRAHTEAPLMDQNVCKNRLTTLREHPDMNVCATQHKDDTNGILVTALYPAGMASGCAPLTDNESANTVVYARLSKYCNWLHDATNNNWRCFY